MDVPTICTIAFAIGIITAGVISYIKNTKQ